MDRRLGSVSLTFLGTGTSLGVPMVGCGCDVCISTNSKDNRLRSSVLIQSEKSTVVIDTGPDFRYQMLRQKVNTLDAIVFTHEHRDHTAGLDDIRAFNFFQEKEMIAFATPRVQGEIQKQFPYIFGGNDYPGLPKIVFRSFENDPFLIGNLDFVPIKALHYKMPVSGFRIGDITYITDANFISEGELEKARGSKVFILNALREKKHVSHFTLEEATKIAQNIGADQTYFTHISHQLGEHEKVSNNLPEGIFLAYDGLTISA